MAHRSYRRVPRSIVVMTVVSVGEEIAYDKDIRSGVGPGVCGAGLSQVEYETMESYS